MKSWKILLSAAALMATAAQADEGRWYSQSQVAAGKELFAQNCAECHGKAGEATPDWRVKDDQGRYPAPPLNGSAHTWHHSLGVLRQTIREGGAKVGGAMPGFGDELSAEQIDAVIAYVQSLWPDDIYATWAKANPADIASVSAASAAIPEKEALTARLAGMLPPQTAISEPEPTPVDDVYEVKAGGQFLYIDRSGRYIFTGNLIDLGTGKNLTEAKHAVERASKIAAFSENDKVVFAAEGEQRGFIDVFTDTTCPYCRKLHSEVAQLQAAGITVRYVAFPRGGRNSQGDQELRAVWCAPDPVQGMHQAKMQSIIPDNDGSCAAAGAVAAGYQLGIELGVSGTPAIVLPDGTLIPGYRPHKDLIAALGIGSTQD